MRLLLWTLLGGIALGCGSADKGSDGPIPDRWVPAPGTTWQWQLDVGAVDTSIDVEMYDIDLFDVSEATIAQLQADGRVVICYFSAGSREDWRVDAGDFAASEYGDNLDGWPGEHWLDIRSDNARSIMAARMDRAVDKGCDGVEPDNVDGYSNQTGFDLSENDQLDFNRFLAVEAHDRGLSVGLKNAVELAHTLEPDFDWTLNESCMEWDECRTLHPFIEAGKAVFHTEYVDDRSDGADLATAVCGHPDIADFSTLIKTWDLDAWLLDCRS